MSDRFRKFLWFFFLILAVFLLAVGFLPVKSPKTETYTSRGTGEMTLQPIRHLSSDDLSNQGDAESLTSLPGVGPVIAQEILLEREGNGIFHYPEDLTAVNGIGEKKLEQIRPMLSVLSDDVEE